MLEQVQLVVTWGPPFGQTDRLTRLKTLPSPLHHVCQI